MRLHYVFVGPYAEWFSRAFRKELPKLARLFGEPPAMNWGLVYMRT
jgi:hypothetical protein